MHCTKALISCYAAAGNTSQEQNMAEAGADKATVVIKKYANRRLYNTATSSYVTLDHLCQMVKDGVEFAVYDAKSGEDITRSVLTQIIVEEESKGQNLLPINFLRQLISFYGDNLQFLVPRYLEHTMEYFARNQESLGPELQQVTQLMQRLSRGPWAERRQERGPNADRPGQDGPKRPEPHEGRRAADGRSADKPAGDKPAGDKPADGTRPSRPGF